MHIADLQRASVVDLLRLLDYPSDYVPVLTRHAPADAAAQPASERVDVVDKGALNARLARSYLVELLDRARIVWLRRKRVSAAERERRTGDYFEAAETLTYSSHAADRGCCQTVAA